MFTPKSSAPSGNWPSFANVTLHFDTNAAIDRTLARGPIVAASNGIAVEANHQSLNPHHQTTFHHFCVTPLNVLEAGENSLRQIIRLPSQLEPPNRPHCCELVAIFILGTLAHI